MPERVIEHLGLSAQLNYVQKRPENREFLTSDAIPPTNIVSDVAAGLLREGDTRKISFDSLQETFVSRIIQKRQAHNSRTPLSRLPIELLVKIIHFTVEIWHKWRLYFERLHNVALVSTAFYRCIHLDPSFWALASSFNPVAQTQHALKMSGASGLTVDCTFTATPDKYLQFLEVVQSQMERCVDLHVDIGSRWTKDVRKMLEAPAPQLHRVCVAIRDVNGAAPIAFFNGNAPNLNSVEVSGWHGAGAFRSLWKFSDLREIILCYIQPDFGPVPSLIDVMTWLRASPNMVVLKLEDVHFTHDTPLPEIIPLHLPHLSILHITSADIWEDPQLDTPLYLLPLIQTPSLSDFHFCLNLRLQKHHSDYVILNKPLVITSPSLPPPSAGPALHIWSLKEMA